MIVPSAALHKSLKLICSATRSAAAIFEDILPESDKLKAKYSSFSLLMASKAFLFFLHHDY